MAEHPALPIWTDAYLADTHPLLSLEEHGCYFLLLQFAWRSPECRLPDDDKLFARMLGVSLKRWRSTLRPSMERFWTIENGFWKQKRLSKEKIYVTELTGKRANAGSKGGKAKAQKNKDTDLAKPDICQDDASDLPEANAVANAKQILAPTPTPTPTPTTTPVGGADAPPADLDTLLYQRGKQVLGKSAGGQITKLKQAHGTGKALELIEQAGRKENPAEYVAGILRNGAGETDYSQYTRHGPPEGMEEERAKIMGTWDPPKTGDPGGEMPGFLDRRKPKEPSDA